MYQITGYFCNTTLGESTLTAKRGRQHPLGYTTRQRESAPSTFGCGMVLLVASWDRFRLPVALGLIDPSIRGHHNSLLREMLKALVPPAWTRTRVVVADADFAANATMRFITEHKYGDVCARPRTRQVTNGTHRRALVPHLPNSCDQRRARYKPDGRRKDDWVCARRATLQHLGDVTIVLSTQRRTNGPKSVKMLVTHLPEARGGTRLRLDAGRWGIALTLKELKSGLHLGDMQVTKDPEHVARSVTWSGLAYLLLVRLDGHDQGLRKEWSRFQRKERFAEEVAQEAVIRTELKWPRKLKRFKHVA